MQVDGFRRFKSADRAFQRFEAAIALLARCQPKNAAHEQERLLQAFRAGAKSLPQWSYAPIPDFSPLLRELEQTLSGLPRGDGTSELYFERAQELELETRLVSAIGGRELKALAARRFGGDADSASRSLAEQWSCLAVPPASSVIESDDLTNPGCLYLSMSRKVGALKLPLAVKLSDALQAAAATGPGQILVARGRRLTELATERIVVHEVYGHALPRYWATQEDLGLFVTGTAGGNDEQEGYALWLEESGQLLCDQRRRELGLRHLAALSVFEGADWAETLSLVMDRGAPLEEAAQIASRAHRAGGLGREVVYLPALGRVRRALSLDPELAAWLARGRLTLRAIAQLRPWYSLSAHENSAITGT